MDKSECEDIYSESETEEHLNGKMDLYEWIKKQKGVTNAILEGWIPETKQRPDIMFEYSGQKFVIEFQCTPIATQYDERHELYHASGIIDVWILGMNKYFKKNMRKKYIQDKAFGFYSVTDKYLIQLEENKWMMNTNLKNKIYSYNGFTFCGYPLSRFSFNNGIYNKNFGVMHEILNKRAKREETRLSLVSLKRRKNTYYVRQRILTDTSLRENLSKLSNENWRFYIYESHSKYHLYKFITAYPKCGYLNDYITDYSYNGLDKKYTRINIDKLTDYQYIRCSRDIEYLKSLLLPIMVEKKKQLLKHSTIKLVTYDTGVK